MPNQRAADQTMIAFALPGELLRALDDRRALDGSSRSEFVRQAIVEELQRRGVNVPPELSRAPDRARKVRQDLPP